MGPGPLRHGSSSSSRPASRNRAWPPRPPRPSRTSTVAGLLRRRGCRRECRTQGRLDRARTNAVLYGGGGKPPLPVPAPCQAPAWLAPAQPSAVAAPLEAVVLPLPRLMALLLAVKPRTAGLRKRRSTWHSHRRSSGRSQARARGAAAKAKVMLQRWPTATTGQVVPTWRARSLHCSSTFCASGSCWSGCFGEAQIWRRRLRYSRMT
mmetsp:Transcript_66664/g.168082  ORF Transcript_66664/g.168082 Transcript_66664/m.168082 type:complete len:207 (+) Transcript_66664:634-1254(+)